MPKALHENNRQVWNEVTPVHNSHKLDQAAFLRNGGSTLFPEEIKLLGEVKGKSLLHLQCNAGQDTLSLAQMGAHIVGVDISDEAISFAERLAIDAGIPARFERSDLYDWFETAISEGQRFDRIIASYGAVMWLSDIQTWGQSLAKLLNPGGRFVLVEFHPMIRMLYGKAPDQLKRSFNYFGNGSPRKIEGGMWDYVGASGNALSPSGFTEGTSDFQGSAVHYQFDWTVSEVMMALIQAGLSITRFEEYPYVNGCRFLSTMILHPGNRWHLPDDLPSIPLMYGLCAEAR